MNVKRLLTTTLNFSPQSLLGSVLNLSYIMACNLSLVVEWHLLQYLDCPPPVSIIYLYGSNYMIRPKFPLSMPAKESKLLFRFRPWEHQDTFSSTKLNYLKYQKSRGGTWGGSSPPSGSNSMIQIVGEFSLTLTHLYNTQITSTW